MREKNDQLILGDCLEVLKEIGDKSIDCVICDLPYGTTAASWDKVVPMNDYVMVKKKTYTLATWLTEQHKQGVPYSEALSSFEAQKRPGLWSHYERVIKDKGAIVLFGSEPFSTLLRASNQKLYKYDWVWKKGSVDGFFNAQCRPLKTIEMISVFSKAEARAKGDNMNYYPQGLVRVDKAVKESRRAGETDGHKYFRGSISEKSYTQAYTNYPTEILEYKRDKKKLHPTQKPVALLEYLIKTYTNEGDLVLDNCCGSGSTLIAAINTNRHYIGIEKDPNYYSVAKERIEQHEC